MYLRVSVCVSVCGGSCSCVQVLHMCTCVCICSGLHEYVGAFVFVCVCARQCDTQLSLSDASLPWLQIKNTCTVSPQGARKTASDWQQQRDGEKRESGEGDKRTDAKVKTRKDNVMLVK